MHMNVFTQARRNDFERGEGGGGGVGIGGLVGPSGLLFFSFFLKGRKGITSGGPRPPQSRSYGPVT